MRGAEGHHGTEMLQDDPTTNSSSVAAQWCKVNAPSKSRSLCHEANAQLNHSTGGLLLPAFSTLLEGYHDINASRCATGVSSAHELIVPGADNAFQQFLIILYIIWGFTLICHWKRRLGRKSNVLSYIWIATTLVLQRLGFTLPVSATCHGACLGNGLAHSSQQPDLTGLVSNSFAGDVTSSTAQFGPNGRRTDDSYGGEMFSDLLNIDEGQQPPPPKDDHQHLNCPFRAHPDPRYSCKRSRTAHYDGFRNIADLHIHLNKQHGLLFCTSCFDYTLDSAKAWRQHKCLEQKAFQKDKSEWPGYSESYPTKELLEEWTGLINGNQKQTSAKDRWWHIYKFIFGQDPPEDVHWQYFKPAVQDQRTSGVAAAGPPSNAQSLAPPAMPQSSLNYPSVPPTSAPPQPNSMSLEGFSEFMGNPMLQQGVQPNHISNLSGYSNGSSGLMPPPVLQYHTRPTPSANHSFHSAPAISSDFNTPNLKRRRAISDAPSIETESSYSAMWSQGSPSVTLPSSQPMSAIKSSPANFSDSNVYDKWAAWEGSQVMQNSMSDQGLMLGVDPTTYNMPVPNNQVHAIGSVHGGYDNTRLESIPPPTTNQILARPHDPSASFLPPTKTSWLRRPQQPKRNSPEDVAVTLLCRVAHFAEGLALDHDLDQFPDDKNVAEITEEMWRAAIKLLHEITEPNCISALRQLLDRQSGLSKAATLPES